MARPSRSLPSRIRIAASLVAVFLTTTAQNCFMTLGPNGLCAGLRLDPSDAVLGPGETLIIRINANACTAANGCSCSTFTTATWRSASPKIATVDPTGAVKAVNPGEATILLVPASGSNWQQIETHIKVVN
jgi:hypothetical protein